MNRTDQIQAKARDIATHIHTDPEKIKELADQLITLACMISDAVGKSVAIAGETVLNNEDDATGYTRYRTGEDMQRAAMDLMDPDEGERFSAVNPGVDIERWGDGPLAWVYQDRRPEQACPAQGCSECGRKQEHKLDCSVGRTAERPVNDGHVHHWVKAINDYGEYELNDAGQPWILCTACGVPRMKFLDSLTTRDDTA